MPGVIFSAFLFAVRIAMLLRNKNLLICVEVPARRWNESDAFSIGVVFQIRERWRISCFTSFTN